MEEPQPQQQLRRRRPRNQDDAVDGTPPQTAEQSNDTAPKRAVTFDASQNSYFPTHRHELVNLDEDDESDDDPDGYGGSNLEVNPPLPEDVQNINLSGPMFLLVVAIAMFGTGRFWWGLFFIVVALVVALASVQVPLDETQEREKQEIRFGVMGHTDILEEMIHWEAQYISASPALMPEYQRQGKIILATALAALAARAPEKNKQPQQQRPNRQRQTPPEQATDYGVFCQEAVYLSLRTVAGDDDRVLTAGLSLLALVARDPQVRERHMHEADFYGLDRIVRAVQTSLNRAKKIGDEEEPNGSTTEQQQQPFVQPPLTPEQLHVKEQEAAEVQRRAALLWGALADGDREMARYVVQEGCLDVTLAALDWYRCHSDVVNWALWAIFNMCWEGPRPNKAELIRSQGIPIILNAMEECGDHLDVARHGVAVLFDLLREEEYDSSGDDDGARLDIWRIRNECLNAGLHKVLLRIIENFAEVGDVAMMTSEILKGTGYQGQLPTIPQGPPTMY